MATQQSDKHMAFVCCVRNITAFRYSQVHLTKLFFYSSQKAQNRQTQNISARYPAFLLRAVSQKLNPGQTLAMIDTSRVFRRKSRDPHKNAERGSVITMQDKNKES